MDQSQSALDWQRKIYLDGFAGRKPLVNIDFHKLEQAAKAKLSAEAYAYIAGGAGNGTTILNNRTAFDKYRIVPRMLKDVGVRGTSIELFGKRLPSPLLLAPIGVLSMAHKDADLAVAKAAASVDVPFIFSNQASVPMETCANVMGQHSHWFQLYWSKSKELVGSFVARAEACGCSALVVTLDTTMLGWRTQDLDLAYLPFLRGLGIAQYTSDPVFQKLLNDDDTSDNVKRSISFHAIAGLIKMVNNYPGDRFFAKLRSGKPLKAVRKFISIYSNPCTTWDDLKFLRELTSLPILLKGILHPNDAQKALDYGMDGIIVSNHGGRQVDGAIGTLDALPAIAKVVDGRIPILLDSGVRGGADMFKALALGAKAVCIGRSYVYGLALAGQDGVQEVIRNYMSDFELTMGLAGCRNVSEISGELIAG